VLRLHPQTRERHLDWLIWGLLPHGTRDPDKAPRPIHARAETIAALPTFADAFRHRRAIVPATEYYLRKDGTEERYAIQRRDGQPLAIAGLWESWWRRSRRSSCTGKFLWVTTKCGWTSRTRRPGQRAAWVLVE
jgi:putative SOS response-associated peptidase YedK